METVALKIVISSAILLAFYHVFLAKERMFKFNRIYLIASLIFSYSVPLIAIPSIFKRSEESNLIFGEPLQTFQQIQTTTAKIFDWNYIILGIYILISTLLLLKFIYSILKIKFLKGDKISYQNQKLIVLEQNYAPFSFLKTIYIGKTYFVENKVNDRIFLHEKCHVAQNHSIDILFLEFLKIISWFNPAIYLYKYAMITKPRIYGGRICIKGQVRNRFQPESYSE